MMMRQSTRDVEEIGAVWACRGMENIEYIRCTEATYIRYREEKRLLFLLEVALNVVGEGGSCVKKEESAAAEEHRRGTVQ